MRTTSLTAPLACWLALMVPQGALAAGGPVAPVQGSYIGVPGSPDRYAAFDARGNTVVKRQEVGAGPAVSELRVSGPYGIPGVDYRGSMTGLSADGRNLILAELPGNGPPRTTRLLVLDTKPLAVRARLTLRGWSTVDAISPGGRWLYLIHYVSSNVSRYEVQAYDLSARRLLAKPVVDPRDRGEAMIGVPLNRVMSASGRWAYTLYLRPSGVPFVHALDTTGRRAVCIDLPSLSTVDTGSAHLALGPGGTTLHVDAGGATAAVIDTRTFTVSAGGGHSVAVRVRLAAHGRRDARGQRDVAWELIVLSVAALGVVAFVGVGVAKSRRHRPDYGRGPEGATVTDREPTDGVRADEEAPVA
ncbi:MAG: hypothetical protein ACRDNK_24615 [Solirubrobacteraceae bacterium]